MPLDNTLSLTEKDINSIKSSITEIVNKTNEKKFSIGSKIITTSGIGNPIIEIILPEKVLVKKVFNNHLELTSLKKYMFCALQNPDPFDNYDKIPMIDYYYDAYLKR